MENEVKDNTRSKLDDAMKEAEQLVTKTVNTASTMQGGGRVSHFGLVVLVDNAITGERLFTLRQPLDLENNPRTRLFLGVAQKRCPNPGDTCIVDEKIFNKGFKLTMQFSHRNPDMDIDEAEKIFFFEEKKEEPKKEDTDIMEALAAEV